MTIPESWRRIEEWLGAQAPVLAGGLRPGAADAEIEALATSLKVSLPDDLVASFRCHDGQAFGAPGLLRFGDHFQLLSLAEIRTEAADWARLAPGSGQGADRRRPRHRGDGLAREVVAAAGYKAGDGSLILVDLAPTAAGRVGQLFSGPHDEEMRKIVAPSLAMWLERLADELHAGRYELDESYGILSRLRAPSPDLHRAAGTARSAAPPVRRAFPRPRRATSASGWHRLQQRRRGARRPRACALHQRALDLPAPLVAVAGDRAAGAPGVARPPWHVAARAARRGWISRAAQGALAQPVPAAPPPGQPFAPAARAARAR